MPQGKENIVKSGSLKFGRSRHWKDSKLGVKATKLLIMNILPVARADAR